MDSKKQVITWDHFEDNASKAFRQLWNDQHFADVTLVTDDDQEIRAHKVILSSSSPFLRNALLKNTSQNLRLHLKDIRYKELAMVIKFIYLGQCDVGEWELQDFLNTGNDLEINGLLDYVEGSCCRK